MRLYCRDGIVLAWHDDDQNVPPSAYGEGVVVVPYEGLLGALDRVGDPVEDADMDRRPYKATPLAAQPH